MRLLKDELSTLARHDRAPSVSIYLPTHRTGPEKKQDAIRLKKLLGEAKDRLTHLGMSPQEVRGFLAEPYVLLGDKVFWIHRTEALCLLVADDRSVHYDLPVSCEPMVFTGARFHLKPMLQFLDRNDRFFLLTLSQNASRLYICTRFEIEEMEVEGMPSSLDESLAYSDPEKQLQFHTGTASDRGGRRAAVFHGQGKGADDAQSRLLRYFNRIDGALRPVVAGRNDPLVLAGVEYLHPLYREANSYPHLMEAAVSGNPEDRSATELHAEALGIVRLHLEKPRHEAVELYERLKGSGDSRSVRDLKRIVRAAHEGRVQHLFVAVDRNRWGSFDAERDRVEIGGDEPHNEDLLDLAAVQTFLTGGSVHAVSVKQVPDGGEVAAVLRF